MRSLILGASILLILVNLAVWLKLDALHGTSERWYMNCLNPIKPRG